MQLGDEHHIGTDLAYGERGGARTSDERKADAARRQRPTSGQPARGLHDVKLHLVDSVDTAYELMRWLSTKDQVAVDTETTGLDTTRDYVRLVQVGDEHHGWAIPWHQWGGVFTELVRKFQGRYILHNMPYDWAMLANSCDIKLPRERCDDTRVMAHVLHPDRSTALKSLTRYYVDPHAAALSQKLDDVLNTKGGWTWATIPIDYEPYWSYGALDTVLTAQLEKILHPRVMAEAPQAYELECAAMWVALSMRERGIKIDRQFTQEKHDTFTKYCDELISYCTQTYGMRPGESVKIIRHLLDDGVELTKRSAKTGNFSLDKDVLDSLAHPLAEIVRNHRRVSKITSTYLANFLKLADGDDLLHPSINTLGFREEKDFGVITGRMSMSEPNLQNLPRYTLEPSPGNTVRNCIVPREGHTLLMCDFSQIEARLIAHLTNDAGFIEAFKEGDFFTNITRMIWDDDTIEKKDPRRQATKNGVYARAYGAGAPKFAKTTGIEEAAAVAMYARLDQLFPGWGEFTRNVERIARTRLDIEGTAYVSSPITGRRHVTDEKKIYVLTNYLIQGTAAEIFKMKLVQLAQAGLDEYMVVPVHDEIIQDVPNDVLHDVAHTTLSIMNDDQLLSLPLTAEASYGLRWGEKKDYVGPS